MIKKLCVLVASLFTSTAYGQLYPTMPNVNTFYCDECFVEYSRMRQLNDDLNGPCCLEQLSQPCCVQLGAGIRNALEFYRLCAETCEERPWWVAVSDDRFTIDERILLLEMYQESGEF